MGSNYPPEGELGQIGPHGDPNGDAAWLASQASAGAHPDNSDKSYSELSKSPSDGGASKPSYDSMKHTGRT